jgi:hypothetical protein
MTQITLKTKILKLAFMGFLSSNYGFFLIIKFLDGNLVF